LIRGILQELGTVFIRRLVSALRKNEESAESALEEVRTADLRRLLRILLKSDPPPDGPTWTLEWLLGQRVLKRHREHLHVHFRLDTVESKTQVLRDLVVIGSMVGELQGIYLLLDELEKQAGVLPRSRVVRYLFALRALIDSLPKHLFVMLAMTPSALAYYKSLVPAIAGRLPDSVEIEPIKSAAESLRYYRFYLRQAQENSALWAKEHETGTPSPGTDVLIADSEVERVYEELRLEAVEAGAPPVLQREFFSRLHNLASRRLEEVEG
ncbi:MAG: hypothetical protein AAFN41_06335, partial [Planctomycetota bacterium]